MRSLPGATADDDLALVLVKACVLLVMERAPLPPVIETDGMLGDLVRLFARDAMLMQTLRQQARRWSLSLSRTPLPRLPTTHHRAGGTLWTCPQGTCAATPLGVKSHDEHR